MVITKDLNKNSSLEYSNMLLLQYFSNNFLWRSFKELSLKFHNKRQCSEQWVIFPIKTLNFVKLMSPVTNLTSFSTNTTKNNNKSYCVSIYSREVLLFYFSCFIKKIQHESIVKSSKILQKYNFVICYKLLM